jgi:cell division protein FtsZ
MTLQELEQASDLVHDRVDPEASIIWGATVDEEKRDRMRVMILATGFVAENMSHTQPKNGISSKPKTEAPRVGLIHEETSRKKPLITPPEVKPQQETAKKQEEEDLDIPAFLRRLKK